MSKIVFITGAVRFLSFDLYERFIAQGIEVIRMAHRSKKSLFNREPFFHLEGVAFYPHDVIAFAHSTGKLGYGSRCVAQADPLNDPKTPSRTPKEGSLGNHDLLSLANSAKARKLRAWAVTTTTEQGLKKILQDTKSLLKGFLYVREYKDFTNHIRA